jgi:hypothetical protein
MMNEIENKRIQFPTSENTGEYLDPIGCTYAVVCKLLDFGAFTEVNKVAVRSILDHILGVHHPRRHTERVKKLLRIPKSPLWYTKEGYTLPMIDLTNSGATKIWLTWGELWAEGNTKDDIGIVLLIKEKEWLDFLQTFTREYCYEGYEKLFPDIARCIEDGYYADPTNNPFLKGADMFRELAIKDLRLRLGKGVSEP